MDKTELSTSLEYFIAEAKKKDGGKYPSNSIYDLFSSIQGYIRHKKSSSINFFTDPEFLRARQVLDAIMKERATEGLGSNTRKQADVISIDEEKALYDRGILGIDNPQQLLDTLLYLCGLHFALRGGNEHRRLRLNLNPQITGPFQDKDAKLRYLLYKEDVSEANAGTVKRLCTRIGLTGKRTNHSLRASSATRLYNAGIEEQRVAETTGHRSKAVRVYKRTSVDQPTEASNILYGLRPSDGSKKAKPSAAAGALVGSASVEYSTDENSDSDDDDYNEDERVLKSYPQPRRAMTVMPTRSAPEQRHKGINKRRIIPYHIIGKSSDSNAERMAMTEIVSFSKDHAVDKVGARPDHIVKHRIESLPREEVSEGQKQGNNMTHQTKLAIKNNSGVTFIRPYSELYGINDIVENKGALTDKQQSSSNRIKQKGSFEK
ncbi:unnamed protein product [Mytilus coruscus]|uniref:Uncharacterized protein n=1 Tax=Mytilus coruscus TaxID=42192 RepID=A0A6J8AS83_MYTCO|nr:unnamed protein product [Mytilus coruscus]